MSITIRISQELDGYIRGNGTFGDDHESVLRRLLGFMPKRKRGRPRNDEPKLTTDVAEAAAVAVAIREPGLAEVAEKLGPGRPRSKFHLKDLKVKRGRGRPRKEKVEEKLAFGERAFRKPLLEVLYKATEHQLTCRDAINAIEKLMGHKLGPKDWERHQTNAIRWKNNVQWARNTLVQLGYIERPNETTHGLWRLTPRAVEFCDKKYGVVDVSKA